MSAPNLNGVTAWANYNTTTSAGIASSTFTSVAGRGMFALVGGDGPFSSPSTDPTFSDNYGNTWVTVGGVRFVCAAVGTNRFISVAYCANVTTAGSAHVVSVADVNAVAQFTSLWVCQFDCPVALDNSSAVSSNTAPPLVGSLTTTAANTLVVASSLLYTTVGTGWTWASTGWTWPGELPNATDPNDWDLGVMYQTAATAGSYAISANGTDIDPSQGSPLIMASFVSTASGAPALTGVSSTSSVGGLGAGVQHGVTATSSTSAPGNVGANISLALSGVSSTTSVGTLILPNPTLSSISSTTSVGTTVPGATLALTGASSTTSATSVGPGLSQVAAAVSSTTSINPMAAAIAPPLTGTVSTGSVHSATPSFATAIAAVSSATSVTAAGANVSVALSGVGSTCSVGSVIVPGVTPLGPVTASGAVGSLSLGVGMPLVGVTSTLTPVAMFTMIQAALSAAVGTGSVGSVTFGNVVVGLGGVATFGSAGSVAGPRPRDTRDGEWFFAQQMAQPAFYRNVPPPVNQRGALFLDSGSWVVPPGASNVFVSAIAGGGTPNGGAGQMALQTALNALPGDTLNVTFLPSGDVYVTNGIVQLLYLFAGAAYGNTAWQSGLLAQQSGLPGNFGSGANIGAPFPGILVFYWN